jgi:hypothetical protein
VDDVGQRPGDREVGVSHVAVLDRDGARLEADAKRRNPSAKRSTTLPRIERATSGRRATPRSSRPNMLGAIPLPSDLPSRTSGTGFGSVAATGAS